MGTSVRGGGARRTGGGGGVSERASAGAIIGSTALDRSAVATASSLVSGADPDRVLPVVEQLAAVLPARGLVRGQIVACVGPASPALALALLARASAAGSWLAMVAVPWLGVEAAREAGVALERTVAVDVDPRRHEVWAEALMAAADGVELLLAARDAGLPDRMMRQVRTRVRARGAVLVTLPAAMGGGGPGARDDGRVGSEVDLVLTARTAVWWGLGRGHGRVRGRRLHVEVGGRRMHRTVESGLELRGAVPIG